MRIVHVVDYSMPQMGYQEFLLPKYNAAAGHEVIILTSDRYFPVPNYEDSWKEFLGPRIIGCKSEIIHGVQIERLKTTFEIKGRPWIKSLKNRLKRINPDLIYVHGTGSITAYRIALMSSLNNCKFIYDNHMIFDIMQKGTAQKIYYFFQRNIFSKIIEKRAAVIFGVTEETCDYLVKIEGFNKKNVQHLPLGVDDNHFNNTDRKKIPSLNQYVEILQTGKLNNDKKPQWLAKACLDLLIEGYKIKLKFLGAGDKLIVEQIRQSFNKANFESCLEFSKLTNYKYLPQEFKKSDIAIYPDGTSLSALEAASCGCEVIMADLPASLSREKKGVGITYKRGDITDLKEKIKFLIGKLNDSTNYVNNAPNVISSEYSYKKISEDMFFEKDKK